VALDPNNGSWNVVCNITRIFLPSHVVLQIRSEFDDLLLRHASKCGASVIEETKVTELHFVDEGCGRPVSATWRKTGTGMEGRISFEYLIDASGRNGIMSTKYLKNRRFNQALNNVACWGYWEGTDSYMPGTTRENAVWVEALDGTRDNFKLPSRA
jgi:flavin-dependent dehydrogenase